MTKTRTTNKQNLPAANKPHIHTRLWIILAALITVCVMMILIRIPQTVPAVTVLEKNGMYNLTAFSLQPTDPVRLLAPAVYYPNFYLSPENAESAVPQSISSYGKNRADYLSQRFLLLLPDENGFYTLTFRVSGRHALRVYVNGILAGETGKLGATRQDTTVWENYITVNAAAKNGKMDILLNSAQFYHAGKGATLANLTITKSVTGEIPLSIGNMKGFLVMGALLSAAVSLLGIYLLLARTKATLYFALACVAMAVRECVQSQTWVLFPFSGDFAFMLEYLSLALLTIFLSLYLGQYPLGKFLKTMQRISLVGSVIYGFFVLFTDAAFYTAVLKYYQILLLCVIACVGGLFLKMPYPSKEQIAALYGIAVFYVSAAADILMYLDVFGDTNPNRPVSEATMLIFALAQVFSLYLMNNRVLSDAKETERTLAAEKAALEDLNRLKTEFLGNASHELKTPLTVISGYAQTVKKLAEKPEPLLPAQVARRMTLISSEAERLSLMVSQVLDVTRMDEGRMLIEPVRCYAEEVIHAAVSIHYPILNKNRNKLAICIDNGLPAVYADPARLSQVIVNLIANAVRFTADGRITVSAEQRENTVLITVADTGCGIAEEELPFVFERYRKKKKSGIGQDTGTGLGLYICKHIIEQHGGTIQIESTKGQGTAISFTLPAAV